MPIFEKPHEDHIYHLCSKIAAGVTLDEIKDIVKNGKFVCSKCGRVAANAINICDPVPL